MSDESTATAATTEPAYEGWAIVELMGHRQTAGLVREVQMAGTTMLRVDTPGPSEAEVLATQFYTGPAIYCVTPCDEATARRLLERQPYNLPPAVRLVLPRDEQPALTAPDHDDDERPF